MNPVPSSFPLGVFDSGVGGLTVVREILRRTPGEQIVYVGDTAHVPYGTHTSDEIRAFSLGIGRYLVHTRGCRAVVVACNRATAAAVETLRESLPVPVVGMEPGVKPAVAATHTGKIGVLATPGTMAGDRFASLVDRHAREVEVVTQPCPGWVEAVESGERDTPQTRALVAQYVAPLIERGVDTLVLGCTHYPVLRPLIEQVAGPYVTIIETGEAVARQVERVAGRAQTTDNSGKAAAAAHGSVTVLLTGDVSPDFAGRARVLLGLDDGVATAETPLQVGRLVWRQGELIDNGRNEPD